MQVRYWNVPMKVLQKFIWRQDLKVKEHSIGCLKKDFV